ncbi:hypothetical protein PBCVCan184_990R [Paramecium bursaria Chlorella virus Can18-4]|nr:hypothetical protein PBCVCan184_990R [Paramecium bursaria Chlorella virus Can18-4]
MTTPSVFRACVKTKKDITKSDITPHSLENLYITEALITDEVKEVMWGFGKGGWIIFGELTPGDVIVFGNGDKGVGGYKYRATVVSTIVDDFPDVPVPEWYNADDYMYRFIITDLRQIATIECSEFTGVGRQSYTRVTGNLAQRILEM